MPTIISSHFQCSVAHWEPCLLCFGIMFPVDLPRWDLFTKRLCIYVFKWMRCRELFQISELLLVHSSCLRLVWRRRAQPKSAFDIPFYRHWCYPFTHFLEVANLWIRGLDSNSSRGSIRTVSLSPLGHIGWGGVTMVSLYICIYFPIR